MKATEPLPTFTVSSWDVTITFKKETAIETVEIRLLNSEFLQQVPLGIQITADDDTTYLFNKDLVQSMKIVPNKILTPLRTPFN